MEKTGITAGNRWIQSMTRIWNAIIASQRGISWEIAGSRWYANSAEKFGTLIDFVNKENKNWLK